MPLSEFIQFVVDNIDKPWSWKQLPTNPRVTAKDIIATWNILPWRPSTITLCQTVTMDDINTFRSKNDESIEFHWDRLSRLLPFSDILNNPNEPWDWKCVSLNPHVTFDKVLEHPEIPWDYDFMSANRNVSIKHMFEHPTKAWDWNYVSYVKSLTISDVLMHSTFPWNYYFLSETGCITLDDIVLHPELPWDWTRVSCNTGVQIADVVNHPELPWDWRSLSWYNINLSIHDVLAHPELPWVWGDAPIGFEDDSNGELDDYEDRDGRPLMLNVSMNNSLNLEDVLLYPELPWFWSEISKNDAITFEDILSHPELPWSWEDVSSNHNITLQNVKDHPELPWDYFQLSTNPMQCMNIKILLERHKDLFQSVIAAIEYLPAGFHKGIPGGGVGYQRQMETLLHGV